MPHFLLFLIQNWCGFGGPGKPVALEKQKEKGSPKMAIFRNRKLFEQNCILEIFRQKTISAAI